MTAIQWQLNQPVGLYHKLVGRIVKIEQEGVTTFCTPHGNTCTCLTTTLDTSLHVLDSTETEILNQFEQQAWNAGIDYLHSTDNHPKIILGYN